MTIPIEDVKPGWYWAKWINHDLSGKRRLGIQAIYVYERYSTLLVNIVSRKSDYPLSDFEFIERATQGGTHLPFPEGSPRLSLYLAGIPEDACTNALYECIKLSNSTPNDLSDIIQFVSTCYAWEIDYMSAKDVLCRGLKLPLDLKKYFAMGELQRLIDESKREIKVKDKLKGAQANLKKAVGMLTSLQYYENFSCHWCHSAASEKHDPRCHLNNFIKENDHGND